MAQATTAFAVPDAARDQATVKHKARIASIDIMRGLVMIIMLMDHVREAMYLHVPVSDPMDVSSTSPSLFFSRLAAHICAPTFVFLTGMSAWLYANPPGREPRSPSGFLFKRGLFLVLLEFTLITLSWFGTYETIWLQVIWAIGLSMIVLSAAVKLPYKAILAIGVVIVFGHNMLTPITFAPGEFGYTLWAILHDRNFILQSDALSIKISYPVLPWIGVILLGYAAGPIYARSLEPANRRRTLVALGLGCLGLLAILRGFNIYGETLPWVAGETGLQTVMSFLNVTKYPPSLAFLLLTLGIMFLLLSWFEKAGHHKVFSYIETYGSAPMFFYLLHLYVLLIFKSIMLAVFGANQGQYWGVDSYYWIWSGTVILAVLLYFPTAAFARYKHSTNKQWVKYL